MISSSNCIFCEGLRLANEGLSLANEGLRLATPNDPGLVMLFVLVLSSLWSLLQDGKRSFSAPWKEGGGDVHLQGCQVL